jgi:hypothetical protein
MGFPKRTFTRKRTPPKKNVESPFLTRKRDKVVFPNPGYRVKYAVPLIVAQPEPPPPPPIPEEEAYEKYDVLRMASNAVGDLEKEVMKLEEKGSATASEVSVVNQRIDEWIEELNSLKIRLERDRIPSEELSRVKGEVDDLIAQFNGVKNRLIHSNIRVSSSII